MNDGAGDTTAVSDVDKTLHEAGLKPPKLYKAASSLLPYYSIKRKSKQQRMELLEDISYRFRWISMFPSGAGSVSAVDE